MQLIHGRACLTASSLHSARIAALVRFLWSIHEPARTGTVLTGSLEARVKAGFACRVTEKINHRGIPYVLEATVATEAATVPDFACVLDEATLAG